MKWRKKWYAFPPLPWLCRPWSVIFPLPFLPLTLPTCPQKKDAPSASQFAAANRHALLIAVHRRTLPRAPPPHHPSLSSDPSPLPQATALGPPPEPPPMLRPHLPSVVAGRHCPPSDGPAATAPTYRRCPSPDPSSTPSTSPASWVAAAVGSLGFSPIARLYLVLSSPSSEWYASVQLLSLPHQVASPVAHP
jgi:hypothetical protein